MINKYNSFDIKFIPGANNFGTSMLIDEASNLNLDYGSIDMKFDVENCRPFISSTDWRNSNDDQHISKGSIFNKEQHEALLHAPILDQNLNLEIFYLITLSGWRIILSFRTHTKGK